MKRFYTTVSVESVDGGGAIRLDGRSVKTPARAELVLPTAALASAVASEWVEQGETIDPRSMPLTGLANAAIDRVGADLASFAQSIAAYAETDLLCYRAETPSELVGLQAETWDPLIEWAEQRYRVELELAHGIIHVAQPQVTIDRFAAAVGGHGRFQLAGLQPLVTISGSLIIALAIAEGEIDARVGFQAAHLDELWQVEQWGEDELALQARANREADFRAAARFLGLLV